MYKTAKISCYISYIVQGVVNNFIPLLFVFFASTYGVSVSTLALIALYSFLIQLFMDLISSVLLPKMGYKLTGILANTFAFCGLILLAILPNFISIVPTVFIASTFYCGGSGLLEVVISPIIENIPSKRKAFEMGIAHSMYSFGAFITIVISFFFFLGLGVSNWWILALCFAILPLISFSLFTYSKYPKIEMSIEKEENGGKNPFKSPLFYVAVIMMVAAGSTELGVAEWSSTFAEIGLNVNKPFGDLYGPALFALTMGVSRFIYAFTSKKVKVSILLIVSGIIGSVGYLLTALSPLPVFSFIGIIMVGIGVAAMWPGVISITASYFNKSGIIYPFLAAAGDVGCCFGSYIIGLIASGLTLNYAFLIATIFPILFAICSFIFHHAQKKQTN